MTDLDILVKLWSKRPSYWALNDQLIYKLVIQNENQAIAYIYNIRENKISTLNYDKVDIDVMTEDAIACGASIENNKIIQVIKEQ